MVVSYKGLLPNFVVKVVVAGGPEPQRVLAVREQE